MTRHLLAGLMALAGATALAGDDPPEGKARLYVRLNPKATLSAPGPKELDPELALAKAANGVIAGRTDKGFLILDVPQADKGTATNAIKSTKLAANNNVADVQPASLDKVKILTNLIIKYKGTRPTDAQLKEAGLEVIDENPKRFSILVKAGAGVSADTIKKVEGIESVSEIRMERTLRIPMRPEQRGPAVGPKAKGVIQPVGVRPANALPPELSDPNRPLWGMGNAKITDVWKSGLRASTVIVAVIDTGVDVTHEDLKANLWVNAKEVGGIADKDDDGNGYVDDRHGYDFLKKTGQMEDTDGHGTHCAGIIGAVANGTGVVGVCPNVKIMALRFMDANGGSNFHAAMCIDYAVANGAKVISASWGGYGVTPDSELKQAIADAQSEGVLFVAAAGNDGHNNDGNDDDDTKHYPSSLALDLPNVIAVMAIGDTENWDFSPEWKSNYGKKSVHLAAPGHGIWSTVPGNKYARYNGTSMATPYVAGAIALTYGHKDFKTEDFKKGHTKVRDALIKSARRLNALKGRCTTEATLDLSFLAAGAPDTGKP